MVMDHVIHDELHLMLRVMDVVIQSIIDNAVKYDRVQHNLSHSRRSYKTLEGAMLNNLMTAITGCGIQFSWHEQDDGKVEWPSLVGSEKLKLLRELPDKFIDCQPAEMVTELKRVGKVLHHKCISDCPTHYMKLGHL